MQRRGGGRGALLMMARLHAHDNGVGCTETSALPRRHHRRRRRRRQRRQHEQQQQAAAAAAAAASAAKAEQQQHDRTAPHLPRTVFRPHKPTFGIKTSCFDALLPLLPIWKNSYRDAVDLGEKEGSRGSLCHVVCVTDPDGVCVWPSCRGMCVQRRLIYEPKYGFDILMAFTS